MDNRASEIIVVVGYLGIMHECRSTDLGYCILR